MIVQYMTIFILNMVMYCMLLFGIVTYTSTTQSIYCHVLSFIIHYCDQYCIQNCSNNSSHLKNKVENGLLSSANISTVVLGMDGAMDDISLFCPASTQVWQALAYHCRKKLMLVSLPEISDF
jgi:hypothetical protein